MVFSSITFLYYFLPVFLLCYFLAAKLSKNIQLQNAVFLFFSLLLYAWGEPKYLPLFLLAVGIAWAVGRRLEQKNEKWLLQAAVGFYLLLLCSFKLPFMQEKFHLTLPLGISFYIFQIVSYVLDISQKKAKAQKSFAKFIFYISMFPQLVAGPIVRYQDIADEIENRCINTEDIWLGFRRFVTGLSKKVLFADNFGALCAIFKASQEKSVLFYWVYALAISLQYYYDFSGYSDMAIGLGRMLGFHFPENFAYPFVSKSITEFWRRWHMTLGGWFRDYVYIPLGGSRKGTIRTIRNIGIVWCLTGLWHGGSINFLLWGAFFAVLLLLEKFLFGTCLKKHRCFAHFYVCVCVLLSFVIFDAESLYALKTAVCGLFGAANLPIWSAECLYYLKSYGMLLLVGGVGAVGLPTKWANRCLEHRKSGGLEVGFVLGAWLLVTAHLVTGSFHPFLYFRF